MTKTARQITNLTKTTVKADPRFHVREDLNFEDDGNHFKGFDYKGLPITTLRSCGETYLSIRADYVRSGCKNYDSLPDEVKRLCWTYNGTTEKFTLDELADVCEKVIAGIKEANKVFEARDVDYSAVKAQFAKEAAVAKSGLDMIDNAHLDFWSLMEDSSKKYALQNLADYRKALKKGYERACNTDVSTMTKSEIFRTLDNQSYFFVATKDNFYINQISKILKELAA